ncbi:LysE/ArgO family amino acid transporter [Comamonas sp. B21-038]|uniref:LysE/ArgO family amino acid transporter n=1 Tax=Comamonas sp. B21-038 TaxID=2918299 RepID=UPI001EFB6256|nr:LysE family transporter [Comamonas sp. B21-038]ULR89965.1 LysE family transporter [Comamonas sp. B21-038]
MWTTSMTSTWLAGFTVCLSLIVSIGAQNLYVLRQAVSGEHVRACVAWCVFSDALLIGIGVAGMAQVLGDSPTLAYYLTLGGALFLLGYGLMALWRAAMPAGAVPAADADDGAAPATAARRGLWRVLGALVVITLFNPHVYLDTVVLVGSIGARQDGSLKWIFVLGAACASLAWFVMLASAGRRLQTLFAKPQAWRVMDGFTGVMMLALAWWVYSGLENIGAA